MRYIIENSLVEYSEKLNTVLMTEDASETRASLLAAGVQELTPTQFNIIRRKSEAWNLANAVGEQLDGNARVSMLYLLMDPACPVWRRDRILAVQGWWSVLWMEYARVTALIADEENGLVQGNTVFDPTVVGNCPYTIWQITTE